MTLNRVRCFWGRSIFRRSQFLGIYHHGCTHILTVRRFIKPFCRISFSRGLEPKCTAGTSLSKSRKTSIRLNTNLHSQTRTHKERLNTYTRAQHINPLKIKINLWVVEWFNYSTSTYIYKLHNINIIICTILKFIVTHILKILYYNMCYVMWCIKYYYVR